MLRQTTLNTPISKIVCPCYDVSHDAFHEELGDGVLCRVGGLGVGDADEGVEVGLVGGGGGPVGLHVGVDETCF